MRLALCWGMPLTRVLEQVPAEELELWAAWERVYGLLGPQRTDWHVASLASMVVAPHLPGPGQKGYRERTLGDYLTFMPWDGLTQAQAQLSSQERGKRLVTAMFRVAAASQRFEQLTKAGRADDIGKEIGKDGEWLGPITGPITGSGIGPVAPSVRG